MNRLDEFEDFNEFGESGENRPEACLVCEAMCPDAVDGTLTHAEKAAFDKHIAGCTHCAEELAEAQRGAAWLGLLKSQVPEPPASLLNRILAETTGIVAPAAGETPSVGAPQAPASLHSSAAPVAPHSALSVVSNLSAGGLQLLNPKVAPPLATAAGQDLRGNVLPFRQLLGRAGGFAVRGSALHPRLAMTAAMAFFSIALTLNLTGVRLGDLRAESFRPTTLQRSAAEMEASAMRSFQNLRVVYQVESRVSELRQDPLWDDQADANARSAGAKPADRSKRQDQGQN